MAVQSAAVAGGKMSKVQDLNRAYAALPSGKVVQTMQASGAAECWLGLVNEGRAARVAIAAAIVEAAVYRWPGLLTDPQGSQIFRSDRRGIAEAAPPSGQARKFAQQAVNAACQASNPDFPFFWIG